MLKTADGGKIQTRTNRTHTLYIACPSLRRVGVGGRKKFADRGGPHGAICTGDNIFYRRISRSARRVDPVCRSRRGSRVAQIFVMYVRLKIRDRNSRNTRTSRAAAASAGGGGARAVPTLENKLEFKCRILRYFMNKVGTIGYG